MTDCPCVLAPPAATPAISYSTAALLSATVSEPNSCDLTPDQHYRDPQPRGTHQQRPPPRRPDDHSGARTHSVTTTTDSITTYGRIRGHRSGTTRRHTTTSTTPTCFNPNRQRRWSSYNDNSRAPSRETSPEALNYRPRLLSNGS